MYSDHIDFPARHSAAWRDFVRRALQKQPHLRPTAAQLLSHPWLKPARAGSNPRSPAAQPVLPQSSPTSTAHAASLKTRLGSPAISALVHATSASAPAPAPAVSTASCDLHGALRAKREPSSANHTGPLADAADSANAQGIAGEANAEAELYTAPRSAASTAETMVSAVSSMATELLESPVQAPTASSGFVDAGSTAAWCTDSSRKAEASRAGPAAAARLAAGRAASKGTGLTVLRAGLALLNAPSSAERPFSSSTTASPLARPCLRTLLL